MTEYLLPTDPKSSLGNAVPLKKNNFNKFINRKYEKYKIPEKKKSFKDICFPEKYTLQIPQKFLPAYINPDTPYDSILVVHKIGAGKTCTSIRIAEEWKHLRKIIVVVPAALKNNFFNELRSECTGDTYITSKERLLLKQLNPVTDKYQNIIEASNARINKYYEVHSYNKFVELYNEGSINLKHKVLIVDEVQNMVSEGGLFYETLHKAIKQAKTKKDNLRTILLSATPIFDKPHEIALTLNLLNLDEELPTGKNFENMFIEQKMKGDKMYYDIKNVDYLKKIIRGRVSYYRGAPSYVFPQLNMHVVKCKMESFQYRSYLTVSSAETLGKLSYKTKQKIFQSGEIMELPNNFHLGTRIISNIAFPNLNVSEKGYDSLNNKNVKQKLKSYSIKFYKILKKVKRSKGPIFIFSNFKEYGGIKSLMKVLEENGYCNYDENGTGKNRFAVWSSDVKPSLREEIRNVYNRKENFNGSLIKIILGSPSMKEGVSLFRVRQIHILEPYWNEARLDQVIGRGVRFCSHKDLDKDSRNVDVYLYIAMHNEIKETVDQYIYKLACQKTLLISKFIKVLKEAAVDCTLFKNANVGPDEEPFVCDV